MKTHMKKLLTSMLLIVCVFALTACGAEKKNLLEKYPEGTEDKLYNQVYLMTSLITDEAINSDEAMAAFEYYNDDDYDNLSAAIQSLGMSTDTGVKMDGRAFVAAINSWKNAQDIIGDVTTDFNALAQTNSAQFEIEVKDKEIIITYPFTGSLHDGSIQYIFDKNLHITSVTTNVMYSLGESMKKAGINTGIGMGTVFTMLIVIMFIISLLGFIPKMQENSKKKAEVVPDSVDKAIAGIVEREETTSDVELVAAISAAIAAYEGESSTDGFVVRSIKRIK